METEALDLLRSLIRIPTWQPEHVERPAAELLAEYLRAAGLEPRLLEAAPGRTNLVVRLRGSGELPPLLLSGHLDTVPPGDTGRWRHPPLAATIDDGLLYGRGAVDMKGPVAAFATVIATLARERAPLRRDLIFAAVAGEETGCAVGSRFLVDEHPEEVRAEHALGEVGGFTQWVGTLPVYPVQVAEKGTARLRLIARGESGHGALPRPDAAPVLLGEAVARLGRTRLPIHPTATVAAFLAALAAGLPAPQRWVLPRLLHPVLGGPILDHLVRDPALQRSLWAMLANTVTPVMLRGGDAVNVVPGEASCELDGRLLPGQAPDDLLRELRQLVGPSPRLQLELHGATPGVEGPHDTPLFRLIAEEVAAAHPGARVVPNLLPGFTDGSAFSRLGTIWYGFAPLRLPRDPALTYTALIHACDERIPVDGYGWGVRVLYRVVRRFSCPGSTRPCRPTAGSSGRT